MSPSRSYMTDSEILRSPTEVLYAVSEKQRQRSSESAQRNLGHAPPPPRAYVLNHRPRSTYTYSSREDLASNDDTVRSQSEHHQRYR